MSIFAITLLIADNALAKKSAVGTEGNPMIVKMIAAEKAPEELKPFDTATIALGAATVVLTAVAVLVATATLLGYKEIRSSSIKAAKAAAEIIAAKVAKDTAEVIAARTIAEGQRSFETTAQEANEVVNNLGVGEGA